MGLARHCSLVGLVAILGAMGSVVAVGMEPVSQTVVSGSPSPQVPRVAGLICARGWRPRYNEGDTEVYSGMTAGTLSTDVLAELRNSGRVAFQASMGVDPTVVSRPCLRTHAEIYGIYFDFAKATIRPESEAVLREIADVMSKNPSWTLRVEGHTDNIGLAASNQQLSLRRSSAVRDALVSLCHIEGSRLIPAGFGASRPKDTNDTLEGRALNRRVELVRQ